VVELPSPRPAVELRNLLVAGESSAIGTFRTRFHETSVLPVLQTSGDSLKNMHDQGSSMSAFALNATVEISALGNSMDLGDLALPIQIR
jgi:hypothetical protein